MKKDDSPLNHQKVVLKGVKKSPSPFLSFLKRCRASIVFRTAIVYVVMFGTTLVIATSVMSAAFVSYSAHSEELERTMSFMVGRLQSPAGQLFDSEGFVQFSKTMIETSDVRTHGMVRFGEEITNVSEKVQTVRQIDKPDLHPMIKIVSTEHANAPFKGGIGIAYASALAGLLIAAILLSSLSTKKLLHPVYVMTRTVRSITASDLNVRIGEGNSNDELDELVRTFNEMLGRLEEAYRKQDRFVSDASYELRTPLSVISGYVNLLRRWGSEDPVVLEESMTKIIEGIDNMQQLVERLLFLTQVDRQAQAINPELFNVSELVSQITKETRLIDDSHTLCEQIEPGVALTVGYALILQAVRTIVENSMKYTPPGGTITLSYRAEETQVCLSVADTGVGVEEKGLPYIFDRSYKADEARSRQAGGANPGLSIIKWIIECHDEEIRVGSIPDHGAEFRILISRQLCLPAWTFRIRRSQATGETAQPQHRF